MRHPWAHRRTAIALAAALVASVTGLLGLTAAPAAADVEPPYVWEAEWGTSGSGEGQLLSPAGMTVGPDDHVYVVDGGNDRVQVFDVDGTFLDQWPIPPEPVVGSAAYGIATDGTTVWVADVVNSRILRFDTDGDLLGEFGEFGTAPGQTQQPTAVAPAGDGNVYVTGEAIPDRVQKFDADGELLDSFGTTGNGPGQLNGPNGVAVGPSGDVYVTDRDNDRVQVFDDEGTFLRGFPTSNNPAAIAVDADESVFVLSIQGVVEVTKYDSVGTELSDWSNFFSNPAGLAVDSTGDVFVTETTLDRVQRFGLGTFSSEDPLVFSRSYTGGLFEDTAVATNGDVYAAVDNCCGPGAQARVQVFDEDGTPTLAWGSTGMAAGQFNDPQGIDIGPDGTVYVAERGNDRVQRFSPTGTFLGQWGGNGTGDGQFKDPVGIVVAADGTVYVGDTDNRRIQVFDEDGTFVDQITLTTHPDRPFAPTGLDIGPDGNLYVADAGNHRLRIIEPDGDLVGQFGQLGDDPGTLSNPWGVSVDADGDVWVANLNTAVQKFTSTGQLLNQIPGHSWVTVDGDDVLNATIDRYSPAAPALAVSVAIDQSSVLEGETIDLHVTVENTGNTALSGVTVTDAGAPDCAATIGALAAGTEQTVDCTHTIPVDSLTFVGGVATFSNSATADSDQTDPVTSAPATVEVEQQAPALTVTQSGPTEVEVGAQIFFAITVENTGNTALTGLVYGHPDAGCVGTATELAVGGQAMSSCSFTTSEDDLGAYSSTFTVDTDQTGPVASNELTVDVIRRGMTVTVEPDQSAVVVGDTITFDLTIENTGTGPVAGLFVSTPATGCAALPSSTLAAGAQVTIACSQVAIAADVPSVDIAATASSDTLGAIDATAVPVAVSHRARPDGQARLGGGAFVGNNRYNATGAQQSRSATVPNRGRATFTVRAQNDGTGPAALRVRGAGSTNRYTDTYKRGATNVTNQVVNGTFQFTGVDAGATRDLTVIIQARNGAPRGAALTRLVTVSSTTTPVEKDVVKLTVTRR